MSPSYTTKKYLTTFLLFLFCYVAKAQLQITADLGGANYDICLNKSRNLIVSVKQGTCSPFLGDLESAVFTWQIEVSPGVWTDIASHPITGVTYTTTKFFNSAETQISSRLIVNAAWNASESVLKYRALIQGQGGCPVATSQFATITIVPNRWLGGASTDWDLTSNWSCGRVPGSTERAVIQGVVPAVMNLNNTVKAVEVVSGASLSVNPGVSITLNGPVVVGNGATFTLHNNASLLQENYTGSNTGTIQVQRNSSALMRQDYTMWSSPVSGQNLLNFSPLTLTNRFYEYNSATNTYSSVDPSATSFQTGKGYLIRMPNTHPSTPTVWSGQFTGVPNNGDIVLSLANGGPGFRFNAIGNPYPSPVRMSTFVNTNATRITGTLYFWRKTNNASTNPGYCIWTLAGFVSNGEAQVVNPNGILRTGQGFIVELVNNQNSVLFNNSMRIANNADQFFRTTSSNDELNGDKFHLNIVSNLGAKNQMLLGYFEEATNGLDFAIDGKAIETASVALTTSIGGEKYLIEGRAPFQNDDIVPLNFETDTAGQFTVSLEQLQGIFSGSQNIYLRDNVTNVLHNLKLTDYVFSSDAGQFQNRFEIRYSESALGVQDPTLGLESVIAYGIDNSLVVKSNVGNIANIQLFDIQGRLLIEKNKMDTASVVVPLTANKQVLLVKVSTQTGFVVTRKIIF